MSSDEKENKQENRRYQPSCQESCNIIYSLLWFSIFFAYNMYQKAWIVVSQSDQDITQIDPNECSNLLNVSKLIYLFHLITAIAIILFIVLFKLLEKGNIERYWNGLIGYNYAIRIIYIIGEIIIIVICIITHALEENNCGILGIFAITYVIVTLFYVGLPITVACFSPCSKEGWTVLQNDLSQGYGTFKEQSGGRAQDP